MLAAIMLVGCKEPAGLSNNDVHASSPQTTYCYVTSDTILTGHVNKWMDGQTPDGWYTLAFGSRIRRALDEQNGYVYPKTYGFCVFDVPQFQSPGGLAVCTLYYKQKDHLGSLKLVFNWLSGITGTWPPAGSYLWHAIDTSSYTLAPEQDAQPDGWSKLALSTAGNGTLTDFAENGGGVFYTGWKFNTAIAGWWTNVWGITDDAVAPYIKVVDYP